MWIMQEQPPLHVTEGPGRFSAARTGAGGLMCLWLPIMEEHRGLSLQGTKLEVRESSILMSVDCPGDLGLRRRTPLKSGPSHLQTHSGNPSGLCLFLKDISTAIPGFRPIPPFFLPRL